MKNYKLKIQYDGTRYSGWQIQGNTGNTIQGKLQSVLSQLDGSSIEIHGSGRTDAGVHAKGQVANVKLNSSFDCKQILEHCATHLPRDIAVISVEEADPRFHARLNAKSKRYVYHIWNSMIPNVFLRKFSYQVTEPLDLNAMQTAAQYFLGTHDFRSFCGLRRFKKSTTRTIYSIEFNRSDDSICISYEGDGFLNLMVRILTGTLIEVGLGQRHPEEMASILSAKDRSAAGFTAPPEGLCLDEVFY